MAVPPVHSSTTRFSLRPALPQPPRTRVACFATSAIRISDRQTVRCLLGKMWTLIFVESAPYTRKFQHFGTPEHLRKQLSPNSGTFWHYFTTLTGGKTPPQIENYTIISAIMATARQRQYAHSQTLSLLRSTHSQRFCLVGTTCRWSIEANCCIQARAPCWSVCVPGCTCKYALLFTHVLLWCASTIDDNFHRRIVVVSKRSN